MAQNQKPAIIETALQLEDYFLKFPGAIVAYSGGVDSGLLAYAARLFMKNNMLAVIADSPSLSRRELNFAKKFAEEHSIPMKVIKTSEMEDSAYLSNNRNRCYFCKKALFQKLKELQQQAEDSFSESSWPLFYGEFPFSSYREFAV